MRAALYARVSTTDQTTDSQAEALRAYAGRRGLEAVEFVDRGQSGAKRSRPAFDRMLGAVRRREVDAVVCVKLDRLARSVRQLTEVAAELEALGVALVVLDQQLDTTTPAGKLLFHTLAAVAEFERDLIRERVAAGMEAARRRGAAIGRPAALDASALQRARRLRSSGSSVREIARLLGVGPSTVQRHLGRAAARAS